MRVTVKGLQSVAVGRFVRVSGVRGAGTLEARRIDGAVLFYFRYTGPDGARVRIPLGTFDPAGKAGLSLAQATAEAGRLSKRYQGGERDLRGAIAGELRERDRLRQVEDEAEKARRLKDSATLAALAAAYVKQLRDSGKSSAGAVERAMDRHLKVKWPALWARPAGELHANDFIAPLAALTEEGKVREAAKLRSYLRAAYAAAIASKSNPRMHSDLRVLALAANPLRDMAAIQSNSPPRLRALSVAELRAYWARLEVLPAPYGPLLRFHLLTGGQRCEQLARVTTADVDSDARTMTLFDGKGRRSVARAHVVPLIAAAWKAYEEMAPVRGGEAIATINAGISGASYYAYRAAILEVSQAMVDAEEATATFTPGDIRRTVETRLAARRVSREVRAHLQSHGLGGVQSRHYDRHDYLDEKREALEVLFGLATSQSASVSKLKAG